MADAIKARVRGPRAKFGQGTDVSVQVTNGGELVVYPGSDGPNAIDLWAVSFVENVWSGPVLLTGDSPFGYHGNPAISEDGSSVVSGPFVGEGIDNSDKASNCAQTAAYKWCFFQTFCIPITGIAVDSEAATELDEDLASEQGGDKPKKKRTSKPASKPPPEQSAEDSKDDRHRKELHEIANTLANGNADAYHAHIRTWTTYKTKDKDEKPVERYCTKASDTYPDGNFILQGKRLDIALSNARDALAASEQ